MVPIILPYDNEFFESARKALPEKAWRFFLARTAMALGYGGISAVAEVAHVSRGMISRGIQELKSGAEYILGDRNRKPGGGRKTAEEVHRRNMKAAAAENGQAIDETAIDLDRLVESVVSEGTYGDPMTTRLWQSITLKTITEEVKKRSGQRYSRTTIRKILHKLHYSQQKNQKYEQVGNRHDRRNDQFENIEAKKKDYMESGDPVISIDAKAKEKLGDFINGGREWRKKGNPRRVLDHDFAYLFDQIYPGGYELVPVELIDSPAIVTPYGVYCLNTNRAYISLGISADTSEFAVESIEKWWNVQGIKAFPESRRLLILADGGGSNRTRGNLFKIAVQQLADRIGLEIEVCHYPPGCSKYDPIEHRLWPHVTKAWTARPLKNLETVLGYVSQTRTAAGLTVECSIDSKVYLTEKKKAALLKDGKVPYGIINPAVMAADLCLKQAEFEDSDMRKWNYKIIPHAENCRWIDYRLPCALC